MAVEPAVRDVRGAQAAELVPRVVEHRVGDRFDGRVEQRRARRLVLDEHARPGRRCRRAPRPGTRTPASAASSSMYASYSTCWRRVHEQRARRVLPREVAPGAGEQLRVGLVAAERGDVQRARRARRDEDRPGPTGCSAAGSTSVTSSPSRCERPGHGLRRSVDRSGCRTRSGPRPRRPSRARPRRGGRWGTRGRCRARRRATATTSTWPTRRIGREQVRRRDDDHRDDDRQPHGGEPRRVGEVERCCGPRARAGCRG